MVNMGWSLPPGCGQLPGEAPDGVTALQEDVLLLLEGAGFSTEVNDKIIDLIAKEEDRLAAISDKEYCENMAKYLQNLPSEPS